MNDHADVALPWGLRVRHDSHSPLSDSVFLNVLTVTPYVPPTCSPKGRIYDPIFLASMYHRSAVPQMIFNEGGIALFAVPWPWAVSLKLARYTKQDPVDCAAVLRLGVVHRGIRWTLAGLE